mgnify:CR=1 FL=1
MPLPYYHLYIIYGLGLWDSLLEGRIKLQKAVAIVNQLPQKETWSKYHNMSSEFAEEANKSKLLIIYETFCPSDSVLV